MIGLTEKRFKIINTDYTNVDIPVYIVKCGDVCFAVYEDKEDVQRVCDKLNNLFVDENNQLRRENEELKQFQDRVFSWIDMHLQRLPKLRDDEFESDNEFADPSLYSGAIQILETMKIELKGDVE